MEEHNKFLYEVKRMKNFEEKVIESILGQLDVSEDEARGMAKGLMSGKIPYILTPAGRIDVR